MIIFIIIVSTVIGTFLGRAIFNAVHRKAVGGKANQELIAELEEELGVGHPIRQLPEWSWKVQDRHSDFMIFLYDDTGKKIDSRSVDKAESYYTSDPYDYTRHWRKFDEKQLDQMIQKKMKAMVKAVVDARTEKEMYKRIAAKYTTPEPKKEIRPQDTVMELTE